MYNLKISPLKILTTLFLILTVIAIVFFVFISINFNSRLSLISNYSKVQDYHIWLIFTKVSENSPLRYKFRNLLENLFNVSSVPLRLHVIVDENSKSLAIDEIDDVEVQSNKVIRYYLYDIEVCAKLIEDIVKVMTPHFSSTPGTYYSDALFYISLGLHRIAPESQKQAVFLDCDIYFKKDVKLLFEEFQRFTPTALFGLAPELTPVYRHVLQRYRSKHKTTFGEFYHNSILNQSLHHPRGFQGYNSGVLLVKLSAIRESLEYEHVIKNETVQFLTSKYQFRGHLGDQDFYTLIGYEYPHMIETLNCGFNKQLCVWWRDHGYSEVFNEYFKCNHSIVVLHGNCNTKIPK